MSKQNPQFTHVNIKDETVTLMNYTTSGKVDLQVIADLRDSFQVINNAEHIADAKAGLFSRDKVTK